MNATNPHFKPRRLEVRWLETAWTGVPLQRRTAPDPRWLWSGRRDGLGLAGMVAEARRCRRPRASGFTIVEMMVVLGIIGLMLAVALPHLSGITSGNSMSTAAQQLVSDLGYARQMAMSHRTTVYVVFAPTNLTSSFPPTNEATALYTVTNHPYGAYAVVSLASVGDQPGQHFPQYLTQWKSLPSGIFISTFKYAGGTGGATNETLATTNTLAGGVNYFNVAPFANISNLTTYTPIEFPFPAADALDASDSYNQQHTEPLPFVAFTPQGQLASLPNDEYIPLARGSVFIFPTGPKATEFPLGNSVSDPVIVHVDALTGRARVERNQF